MVELITVMIIVGVLAAVALPKFFERGTYDSRAAADQVKSALRFGQKVAIAQRRNVVVQISSSPDVDSHCDSSLSAGNVTCSISSRVTLANANFTFDALGRLVNGSGVAVAGSIAVGDSTSGLTTVTIEQETGYVH
jgi:MSHA pilin protein MshC